MNSTFAYVCEPIIIEDCGTKGCAWRTSPQAINIVNSRAPRMRVKIEGFRFLREKYPESGAQFGLIVDTSRLREQENLGFFALVLGQNCPSLAPTQSTKITIFYRGSLPRVFAGCGVGGWPRTHLNLRGGHETLGREGNTPVTRTPAFLWRGEVLLRYRFERDAMGRGGMASA